MVEETIADNYIMRVEIVVEKHESIVFYIWKRFFKCRFPNIVFLVYKFYIDNFSGVIRRRVVAVPELYSVAYFQIVAHPLSRKGEFGCLAGEHRVVVHIDAVVAAVGEFAVLHFEKSF